MSALPKKRWTAEEYLAFESASQERHDFVGSEAYLVSGTSQNHNLIVANLIVAVGVQLRNRPCEIYPSDMLVEITETGDYHYPDVSIVCEPAIIKHDQRDILLNPTVIIEVLSPSTEQYDRSRKFHNYRTVASLQEYLLVSQETPRIERYRRQENGQWLYSDTTLLDGVIELASIDATLLVADAHNKVTFEDGSGALQ